MRLQKPAAPAKLAHPRHNFLRYQLLWILVIALTLLPVTQTIFATQPALADCGMTQDQKDLLFGGVYYFDICSCSTTPGTDSITATGDASAANSSSNAQTLFTFLISNNFAGNNNKPMNAAQAAGVLGNVNNESSFNLTAKNPTSGASGLFQWLGVRYNNLQKYANDQGKPWTDINIQLAFIKIEIDQSPTKYLSGESDYLSRLRTFGFWNATDPGTAAGAWQHAVEVNIGATDPPDPRRIQDAANFYAKYKDLAPAVAIDTSTGAACACVDPTAAVSAAAPSGGVTFTDSESTDTNKQTTWDTDGIATNIYGDKTHQNATSLNNGGKPLDANTINYIALNPGWAKNKELKLGDVAALTYNGKTIYAVYGDNHSGDTPHAEISAHASMALNGKSAPDNLKGVTFNVYPNTASQLGATFDQAKIDSVGQAASGSSTSSAVCDSGDSDLAAANGNIAETAKIMAQWGENYYAGGGHRSLDDLKKRIAAHFQGKTSEFGVDCSGFTRAAIYQATGTDPGPIASGNNGAAGGTGDGGLVGPNVSKYFKKINISQAQAGDIFSTDGAQAHVGIITGATTDGKNVPTIDEANKAKNRPSYEGGRLGVWRYIGPSKAASSTATN